MKIEQWLGEENSLGIDIWKNKYQQDNESFDEWLDRISGGDDSLKEQIRDKKFLFGGRILSNRGLHKRGKKITYSNCYVLTEPEDNIESIFECAGKLARTFSYGGGCGIDISKLAPRGATINNAAKETSGAVSFMDLYSMITGLIGQGGRRGALMLSIDCSHPDLEEFIGIKSDLDRVTKANISVKMSNEFMNAIKNNEDYTLKFTRIETGEEITKTVNARELFHKLCKMNWDMAEPGILFWDNITGYNLLSNTKEFKYAGTNPCFAGNMELLTTDGYKTFEELCDTEPYIYNVNGNVVKSKVWCSGEKETVNIKTGKGNIICTPDHRFMTIDGEECKAEDLKGKYIMPCVNANKVFDERYVKYGFIQGDGQLKRLDSINHEGIEVNIGQKDTDIYELFSNEDFSAKSDRAIYVRGFKDDLLRLGFSKNKLPEREFPSTYESWTKLQKASFLHGCYSANGSVIKNGRISYKTTCKKFAEQLCKTLLEDFNIHGVYITTNKSKRLKFANGEYDCRESYDINIGQYKEITKFIAEINFYQQYKREQLSQMLKNRPMYVYNVTPYKKIKVYDFKEPERHWGIVEGVIVHNCAEEPLPAGGSCLLGSINLNAFADKNTKTFNFEDFKHTVKVSVKALNDVLDEGLPLHPLQEQRDSVRDWRQIGLGVMGIADMLINLGITYGSKESIELCDKIAYTMANTAIKSSARLAREKGSFPKCNINEITSTQFFINNTDEKTRDLVMEYGLRNSQILTIAPTGSISTMLQISGGIEPIFANYYTRKTESLHNETVEYKVYTPIVKEYMNKNGISDDKYLPEFFITAQILDYKNRVDMQSTWQKHIDASISSTVNLPHETTVEQVEELYTYAWEKGLKGITVYRDGCKRSGVLTTDNTVTDDKPVQLSRGDIIEVNDDVIGKKRKLTTGCGSLHCSAFFDPATGELLETYFSKGSTGGCNNFMIGLSRMISLLARSGVNIYSIVEQLNSCGACPSYAVRHATKKDTSKGSCCPVAIGNALLDMYNEMQNEINAEYDVCGEPEDNSPKCPECGENLTFEGGCNICKSCGWSKCD